MPSQIGVTNSDAEQILSFPVSVTHTGSVVTNVGCEMGWLRCMADSMHASVSNVTAHATNCRPSAEAGGDGHGAHPCQGDWMTYQVTK